ncbi:gag-pol polyprotein [Cucumis melo var. makuwa]|uniref:Gag-pol polyprotein n=1 Tax=Cucumis melo var. makuwa TaxID=1194695 RepID=A0A5A7TDL1_CUCMM|nr:gag-pol polyprotein [Cucumis melo var. makuwa]
MEAFLMSLDMRSWRAVISGWEYPTEKDEAGQTVRKYELKWTKDEDDAAILTPRFEALQMGEDETIDEFNVRVLDIANESDALGEKMSDSKLVRKVLRSPPSKFNMKVTAIEEANDLSKMKLDELFGSLRTFEIHLGHTASRRKSGLALTSVKEEPIEEHRVMQGNDALTESVVVLTKQEHERGKGIEASKSDKYGKGIKCHECEELGHIQADCATYLKRKKKGLDATFPDEEDYSESNDEDLGMALISICTMNNEENV